MLYALCSSTPYHNLQLELDFQPLFPLFPFRHMQLGNLHIEWLMLQPSEKITQLFILTADSEIDKELAKFSSFATPRPQNRFFLRSNLLNLQAVRTSLHTYFMNYLSSLCLLGQSLFQFCYLPLLLDQFRIQPVEIHQLGADTGSLLIEGGKLFSKLFHLFVLWLQHKAVHQKGNGNHGNYADNYLFSFVQFFHVHSLCGSGFLAATSCRSNVLVAILLSYLSTYLFDRDLEVAPTDTRSSRSKR